MIFALFTSGCPVWTAEAILHFGSLVPHGEIDPGFVGISTPMRDGRSEVR